MQSYEYRLYKQFLAVSPQTGVVESKENWDFLVALLLKNKLISAADTTALYNYTPSFPCTFDTFINTIC